MSDLISKSELDMNDLIRRKDVLALFPTNDCSDKMVGLYERVLDIPTAFDVEKVVAELKKNKVSNVDLYDENNESWNDDIVSFDTTINIVRKGGVE